MPKKILDTRKCKKCDVIIPYIKFRVFCINCYKTSKDKVYTFIDDD